MRDCRVSHLYLRSCDAEAARHVGLLIEDGLRTASFPDDGGRLVVVRSLALGRIGRHASALTVSMQIEQALQRQRMKIVHATAAEADHADAIFFCDEAEALLTFALQVAQGGSPTGWFWRRVIPGWQAQQSQAESLRLVLRSAIAHAAGSALLLRLVHGMVETGKTDALLDALAAEDGPLLLRHAGWHLPTEATTPVNRKPLQHAAAAAPLLRRRIASWGAEDARTIWLANMLSAIEQPMRMNDPYLSEQSVLWIAQVAATDRDGVAAQSVIARATNDANYGTDAQPNRGRRQMLADELAVGSHRTLGEPDVTQSVSSLPPPLVTEEPLASVDWDGELQLTHAGGLFFLLNLLTRLRFGEWLMEHPQWLEFDLPRQLLAAICWQLAVAEDDPIWQLIAVDSQPEIEGELWEAINDWQTRLADWCKTFADLDLAAIVLRPSRVRQSEMHSDLYFSMAQVDLRIRRVGLDFDPGWVAWLGRVINFHYG